MQDLLGASCSVLASAALQYEGASQDDVSLTAAFQGADAQSAALQMAGTAEALEKVCRELAQRSKSYGEDGAAPLLPQCGWPAACLQAPPRSNAPAAVRAPHVHVSARARQGWGHLCMACHVGRLTLTSRAPGSAVACAVAACYAACEAAYDLALRISPGEVASQLIRRGGSTLLAQRANLITVVQGEGARTRVAAKRLLGPFPAARRVLPASGGRCPSIKLTG